MSRDDVLHLVNVCLEKNGRREEKRKGKERKEEKMREKKGQFQSNLLNLTWNCVLFSYLFSVSSLFSFNFFKPNMSLYTKTHFFKH